MTQHSVLPTIPASEYPERWRKVQALMADQGLDFLVAYADDRATFGPAHARWLANFPVHFEPACVLMPSQGAPVMLVRPGERRVCAPGRADRRRPRPAGVHPSERGLSLRQDPTAWPRSWRRWGGASRPRAGWPGRTRADRRRPDGGPAGRPARCGMGRCGRCLMRLARAEVAGRDRGDPHAYKIAEAGFGGRRGCDPAGRDGARRCRRDRGRDAPGRRRGDGDRHHRGFRTQHPADPGADDLSSDRSR